MSRTVLAGGLADAINWSAAATITEVRGITSGLDNKDHAGSSSRTGLSSVGNSRLADAYFCSTFVTASERMLTRFRRGDMFVGAAIGTAQSEGGSTRPKSGTGTEYLFPARRSRILLLKFRLGQDPIVDTHEFIRNSHHCREAREPILMITAPGNFDATITD